MGCTTDTWKCAEHLLMIVRVMESACSRSLFFVCVEGAHASSRGATHCSTNLSSGSVVLRAFCAMHDTSSGCSS